MIRTQVYIPENIHQQIMVLSKMKGVSMAEIVREFLIKSIKKEAKKRKNDLYKLADLGITGGPKNLSENMNKYLYGGK